MSDQDQDEIILKDLNDDDLVQQMQDDLYDGMIPEVTEGTRKFCSTEGGTLIPF